MTLPSEAPADQLANRHYVSLILRLVIERDGTLVYGEILSLDSVTKGRFTTWEGFFEIVQTGLAPPE
jgi:hypothetical protein